MCFARYRSRPIYDTMREWAKWNQKRFISLADLACTLELEIAKLDNLDGEKVYAAYRQGERRLIADYCLQDAEIALNLLSLTVHRLEIKSLIKASGGKRNPQTNEADKDIDNSE